MLTELPSELIIIYFVSLGLCSLSTIYKTVCYKSMLCRRIMGNMFWSLIPVVNTFKALLWIASMIIQHFQRPSAPSDKQP